MRWPFLAHVSASGGGESGGVNVVLVLGGLALVAMGLGMRARRVHSGVAWWVYLVAGIALVVPGFVTGGEQRPEVTLTLLSPDPGASVRPDQPIPVSLEVKGGKVATSPTDSGGHLHLSVDGALEQMPYGTTTEVRLPRGTHTLRVEYVDDKHKSYDPPIAVEVRVHAF
ncbi:MAG TPA: hypothetical protein VHF47_10275 [Acidimicrobiales bacterium]|nr:hypothetical protein [Acidimicrobiales bacterium]